MSEYSQHSRTALIVGASRGLGLALAEELWSRGWRVIATMRGLAPELDALARRAGGQIELYRLDLADPNDAVNLAQALTGSLDGPGLDLLFVNAGISIAQTETTLTADERDFIEMMMVNAFLPMRLAETLQHLVRENGIIGFMSSELASIAQSPGIFDLYSSSKTALNMLARCFSMRPFQSGRTTLLVAPGWVRTGTGGPDALLSVEESIPYVAQVIEGSFGRPGLHFVDRLGQSIPW